MGNNERLATSVKDDVYNNITWLQGDLKSSGNRVKKATLQRVIAESTSATRRLSHLAVQQGRELDYLTERVASLEDEGPKDEGTPEPVPSTADEIANFNRVILKSLEPDAAQMVVTEFSKQLLAHRFDTGTYVPVGEETNVVHVHFTDKPGA